MADFKLGAAIVHDFKKVIKYFISKLDIQTSGKVLPFSYDAKMQLRKMPRYTETEILFFGKPFVIADADTFLVGYSHIFNKKPYLFTFDEKFPWIIDCGANIGLSVIFFKLNYPEARIIAVEPDPNLCQILKKNVESFGFENVFIIQKALWFVKGEVFFKQEGAFSGMITEEKSTQNVLVETMILDELISDKQVGMLKIDIEGAENFIFQNDLPILQFVKNIFIEYHSISEKPQMLHKILSVLSDSGFRYHLHEEIVSPNPFLVTETLLGMDLQLNIFGKKLDI